MTTTTDAAAPAGTAASRARRAVERAAAYIALTKPRIIETLLVTTVPTMVLAARGWPPLSLVTTTLVGGVLAAGGANTLNCYLDRDVDRLMHRTSRRPLVTGEVSPPAALAFGLALCVGSTLWLWAMVNGLAAGLGAGAILFYVVVYTMLLKRRTPQNIVWGGAAGCMQVLIGWAAVRGSLDLAPFVLFAVIFLWTPPHYWPLAMRFERDYAVAGIPMLSVVASDVVVARRVVGYSWAMVAASVLLVPVAPTGPVYAIGSLVLGVVFLNEAHRLSRRARSGLVGPALNPMRLFHYSITYISLLFVLVAVDPFIRF
ncbi:MAG: heme o synthase [Angustibacter sp.]